MYQFFNFSLFTIIDLLVWIIEWKKKDLRKYWKYKEKEVRREIKNYSVAYRLGWTFVCFEGGSMELDVLEIIPNSKK